MRRPLTYIVVATVLCGLCFAAERRSWNQIRYIGGTVQIKTSRYDWNTTLTLAADAIVVEIAPATVFTPKKTLHIKPSQVLNLVEFEAAWERVAAVNGAQLPAQHPRLFGLLMDASMLGVIYVNDDGKREAILLNSFSSYTIAQALANLTGKAIETKP